MGIFACGLERSCVFFILKTVWRALAPHSQVVFLLSKVESTASNCDWINWTWDYLLFDKKVEKKAKNILGRITLLVFCCVYVYPRLPLTCFTCLCCRVAYSKMAEEISELLLSDISEGSTRDGQLSCFDTVFSAPIPEDLRSNHFQDAVSLFTCYLSEMAT